MNPDAGSFSSAAQPFRPGGAFRPATMQPFEGKSDMAFGAIAGVQPGQTFADRREMHRLGVHRDIRRGICGSGVPDAGAESIELAPVFRTDRV